MLTTLTRRRTVFSCASRVRLSTKRPFSNAALPSHAEIVVIGGGSIGCSTLYHLSKLGADAVLLERDKLSSGTTWHSAGGLWRMWAYDIDVELAERTYQLASDILPNHYGFSTGWDPGPGLFLSANKLRHDEYQRIVSTGKMYGIEAQEVPIAELKSIFPALDSTGVYGAILADGNGAIEPTSWCVGLSRAAATHGGRTFENCHVTEILTSEEPSFGYKKVQGVKVNETTIRCNAIALCTGAWGPKMAAPLGVNIPTMAIKHAYLNTNATKEFKDKPKIRDHDISVYLATRSSGELTIGGYEKNPQFWDEVKDDFVFGLFDFNWDNFNVHFENASKRLPIVRDLGIKSTICGPMSFTPDHRPCMGETPGVRGLFVGCGMDLGIMMGGGYGQELANWVYYGRPSKHMFRFDIARYSTEVTKNKTWLKERVHECHATMYKTKTPHDEPLSGRNLFKSPIHEKLLASGAIFEERMGYERPAWFSVDGSVSPVLEYDWIGAYEGTTLHQNYTYRNRVEQDATFDWPPHFNEIRNEMRACFEKAALFDLSSTGKILISGPDARTAASKIFSNFKGDSCAALALDSTGRIQTDAFLIKPEFKVVSVPFGQSQNGVYVTTASTQTEKVLQIIRHACLDNKFNADVKDITRHVSILSIIGPESAGILQSIFNIDSNIDFDIANASIGKGNCTIVKHHFYGVPGFDIQMKNESMPEIFEKLRPKNVKLAGYRALQLHTTAHGIHSFDAALRSTDYPFEFGTAVKNLLDLTTDREFIGRSAVEEALQKDRATRRLVRVTIAENLPLWGGEVLYKEEKAVGFIRSAGYCIKGGKSVGYAMADNAHGVTEDWLRENDFKLDRLGRLLPATVTMA